MKPVVMFGTALLFAAMSIAASSLPTRSADNYQIDTVHSSMMFRVKHLGTSNFYGRFNSISGSFTLDDDPAKCAFQVQIQAESVDTANPNRDTHLKGPDFFNVKQFPTITFKSTQAKKSGEASFDVTGNLTLHGVTKPVTAKVTRTGSGTMRGKQIAGVEAELRLKRSDFGMSFMLEGLGDDIFVIISLEGIRQ